jgi:hypothetical protein
MGCPEANTIVAFAEGLLAPEERLAIEVHIDQCPGCRRLVSAAVGPPVSERPAERRAPVDPAFTVIAERYRLERRLSKTGVGSVWRARHLELGSSVAIQLLDRSVAKTPQGIARFRHQARAAATLRGRNVVRILDYDVDDGQPFVVTELLRGESLATRLVKSGKLDPVLVASLLSKAGDAIVQAHQAGIVHRDLNPDHIFLSRVGDDEVVKVLGFGIVKTGEALELTGGAATLAGRLLGTPQYMSPEQASGGHEVDHLTDVWALAIVACECLTGKRPIEGKTIGELVLAICTRPLPAPSALGPVPAGFDDWFARSTHREPAERFQSVSEQMAVLRRVCGIEQGGAEQRFALADARDVITVLPPRRATAWRRTVGLVLLGVLSMILGVVIVATQRAAAARAAAEQQRPATSAAATTSTAAPRPAAR